MQIIQMRSQLNHTRSALSSNCLTIGFLGGSITENRVPHNWPESVIRFFLSEYPNLHLSIENAAIGATGSDLGLIRVDSDIISKKPDLVFLEYAVNDWWTPSVRRMEQMEGIIRRLKRYGACDVVLVYTYLSDMYDSLMKEELPHSVKDFEELAMHYQLNSVFSGAFAFDLVKKGELRLDEWLPDGLHPQYRGSDIYAKPIISMIKEALIHPIIHRSSMPTPLIPSHWESATLIPLESIPLSGPFYLKRASTQAFIDHIIHTSAIGAKLTIPFSGRGLVLVFDFGKKSCEFKYTIDGKETQISHRDRPAWCGFSGWLRPFVIGGSLSEGSHTLELEIIHGNRPECEGTLFDLTHVLEIK